MAHEALSRDILHVYRSNEASCLHRDIIFKPEGCMLHPLQYSSIRGDVHEGGILPSPPAYLQRRGDVHEGLKPTTKTATGLKPHEGGILASIPAPPTLGVKLTLAVAVRPSTVEAVTVSV